MLDLAPLNLAELENFVFYTVRVFVEDLSEDLIKALDGFLYSTRTLDSETFKSLLDHFNKNNLKYYTSNILGSAELGGVFKPWKTDLWVDYTGILQVEADKLPTHVRNDLYAKYLSIPDSAAHVRNTIQSILKQFIGHKYTPALYDTIRDSLLTSGLVDAIEIIYTLGSVAVEMRVKTTDNQDLTIRLA